MFHYIDPQHEGWTELMVISDFYLTEAIVFEVERSLLPDIIAGTQQKNVPVVDIEGNEPIVYPADYRFTTKYLDWDVLEPYVIAQCPDFKNLLYEKGAAIPVLRVPFFPLAALKDSTTIDVNRDPALRPEVGALLPGNYTVGVAGAYPTFGGAAGAYVANNAGGAMTGNVTMTEISNIVETATALSTQALGGFTWLTTSNNPHYGDPTAGWQIQCNFTAAVMFRLSQDNNGIMEHEHLRMQWTGVAHGTNIFIYAWPATITVAVGTQYIYIHDILGDGNDLAAGGLAFGANPVTVEAYNCVMWDCSAFGYLPNPASGPILTENCAAYSNTGGLGNGFRGPAVGAGWTCRNCTAYDNTLDYDRINTSTGRYNVSSDATAADINWAAGFGNRINAVVLNDVQGVNDAVANFFDIVVGGPLDSAGEANVIAARTVCVRNRVVPNAGGFTSVGPAEIPSVIPPPPPAEAPWIMNQPHIGIPMGMGMR
jgi:hypothetical protein